MPFDYKKEYKEFYLPPKKPQIITVPAMNFVAVQGKGDPNDPAGEYKAALELLYGIAFTIKMSYKGSHKMDGYFEYVVPPLEGLWHQPGAEGVDFSNKETFIWTSMIRLPEFVTRAEFDWAVQEATTKKKKDFSKVEFFTYDEGLCVQCMHIGSYDTEPGTLRQLDAFAAEQGYCPDFSDTRFHHEIYLGDPHRTGEAENRAATSDPQNEMTENFTKTVAFSCKMCYTKIICKTHLKMEENIMQHETVIVLDFGGQYNQLIARRVRENNVYCEIYSYKTDLSVIKAKNPKGIIFTGGPNSVYLEDSPTIDPEIFSWGVPVLGICYGSQLMMHLLGGHVCRAPEREYGKTEVFVNTESKLFTDVQPSTICWMSHNDYIEQAAPGFQITAHTANCPVAAVENAEKGLYAVQFHPEVLHTAEGKKMLRNFVYNVCGCSGDWKMDSFVENNIKALRERIGEGKVLCALSGGVDSSVLAAMLAKAIGKQLTCVFVDHGLLRKNEKEEVCSVFGPGNANGFDINFICVDARDRYFSKLKGVTEPERKRKIIGEEFIRVFEEEAKKIGKVDFLAQGTIYPDVVESGLGGESTVIKSHHNVGGLPDTVDFKELVEPLRNLFKDEVRQAGRELGLPEYLVSRQPFPGPGLGIRIIGEVTPEKVAIVQDADAIWREEIAKAGLDKEISQYYAALTNMHSVGVMGDERTYDYAVALRAVTTTDFMTAESYDMPWDVLGTVTSRIVNEVKHVNRVFYDCTGKPPATIELE